MLFIADAAAEPGTKVQRIFEQHPSSKLVFVVAKCEPRTHRIMFALTLAATFLSVEMCAHLLRLLSWLGMGRLWRNFISQTGMHPSSLHLHATTK